MPEEKELSDEAKAEILNRILEAWKQQPNLSLGQLLAGSLNLVPDMFGMSYFSDHTLAFYIERYVENVS